MRYKIIAFFLLLMSFTACKQAKTGISIDGKVLNSSGNALFFITNDKVDTVKLNKDGQFSYQARSNNPEFIRIVVPQNERKLLLLVDSSEKITVTFDARNPDSSAVIEGSKGTILLQSIQKQYSETLQKMYAINKRFEDAKQYADKSTFEIIRKAAIDSLKAAIDGEIVFLKHFLQSNPYSLSAITALYQSFDTQNGRPLLLDLPNGMNYFDGVDSKLMARYPKSNTVQDFHQAILALKMSEAKTKEYSARTSPEKPLLKIGDTAPDFEIQTIDNKKVKLSSFKGTTVILDFWASWCPPCREENPFLVAAYNEYHKKGFEVFQVALDKKIETLKPAIAKDKLPWNVQTCDFKSWDSPVAQLYMVNEIPQNFLIDKTGKIIAINCNGDALKKELKKIYK